MFNKKKVVCESGSSGSAEYLILDYKNGSVEEPVYRIMFYKSRDLSTFSFTEGLEIQRSHSVSQNICGLPLIGGYLKVALLHLLLIKDLLLNF